MIGTDDSRPRYRLKQLPRGTWFRSRYPLYTNPINHAHRADVYMVVCPGNPCTVINSRGESLTVWTPSTKRYGPTCEIIIPGEHE